jgi:two-component system, OmpR family, response regulator
VSLRCLLIDDDPEMGDRTATSLAVRGYVIDRAEALEQGRRRALTHAPDVIILDRMLPDGDAVDFLPEWRRSGILTPIILLTVRSAFHERVEGLDSGADDYLPKPFDADELEARIRAVVRRRQRESDGRSDTLICGTIELDYRRREVHRGGVLVRLQPREFKLLELLMLHVGEIVPRAQLLAEVWNLRFDPGTKLIETHVSRLRDKINYGHIGDVIETARGIGYRLRADA